VRLKDITQVQNLDPYIQTILSTGLTQQQLEISSNIAEIENILRHVPFIWREVFSKSVKEKGFTGVLQASEAGDNLDDIMNNPNVVEFTQLLLVLFFTMEASSGEEEVQEE
jgi:hypothetical protein